MYLGHSDRLQNHRTWTRLVLGSSSVHRGGSVKVQHSGQWLHSLQDEGGKEDKEAGWCKLKLKSNISLKYITRLHTHKLNRLWWVIVEYEGQCHPITNVCTLHKLPLPLHCGFNTDALLKMWYWFYRVCHRQFSRNKYLFLPCSWSELWDITTVFTAFTGNIFITACCNYFFGWLFERFPMGTPQCGGLVPLNMHLWSHLKWVSLPSMHCTTGDLEILCSNTG